MRLVRVLSETYQLGLEDDVRWFVVGDDGTVFFPENLVTELSRYNWQEMCYVGSVSERVDMDDVLSYEMAHGAPLVSLHHLDWVSPIDPRIPNWLDSLSAYRADPGRALQQTICYEKTKNWSVSVSWAYTAHIHPWIVQPWELLIPTRTFTTWSNSSDDGPFTFNTRPVGRNPCERPLVYFLDEVEEVEGGPVVTTSYSRFRPGQECGRAGFREALKVETVRVVSKDGKR
ncbi:hypothetical protein QJS10_CPA03g01696 [Acorus calamus]|uniref:Fringe-like glycosyltransferase domain-containing protein n=1 Tax=Acorus calamus TaxID=4465 RepID=A0AAV9F4B0_ACOCL|nr:hypothetical protein QJS10_CPA03g01696 [Acorus calamus]